MGAEVPQPPSGGPAQRGGKPAKDFCASSKTCVVCRDESKGSSRFCGTHKRAYECIYREAHTTTGVASGAKSHFESIFGTEDERRRNAPPDETMMIKVLTDFVASFPEGAGKSRQKRGHVNWSRYTHERGHFVQQAQVEQDRTCT